MNFGLLGAMGGLGGALTDIADTSLREKARAQELQATEEARIRAEARGEDRADAREQRKLDIEEQRLQRRQGLLSDVIKNLPPDATPLQKAEATIGVDPEYSKGMIELAKAQSSTEAQSERIRLAQEKLELSIERLRSGGGGGSDNTPATVKEWEAYNAMPPEQREEYLRFKGRSEKAADGYVPTSVKAANWAKTASPEEVEVAVAEKVAEARRNLGPMFDEATARADARRALGLTEQGSNAPSSGKILRYVPGQGLVE